MRVILQVNFFHFVAEEVRIGLSELGLKSLDDLIGRADLLKQRDLQLAKTQGLDLSYIMSFAGATGPSSVRSNQEVRRSYKLSCCEILQDTGYAWEEQAFKCLGDSGYAYYHLMALLALGGLHQKCMAHCRAHHPRTLAGLSVMIHCCLSPARE